VRPKKKIKATLYIKEEKTEEMMTET